MFLGFCQVLFILFFIFKLNELCIINATPLKLRLRNIPLLNLEKKKIAPLHDDFSIRSHICFFADVCLVIMAARSLSM